MVIKHRDYFTLTTNHC